MTKIPKISVILTVYNTGRYLVQCLDSVINQTLADIEIICINDGSTDNSGEILEQYAARDRRIKIITQDNQGAGAARNTGIKYATGEYLSILDSDDFFEPAMLEKAYDNARKFNSDVVVFRYCNFDNETGQYGQHCGLNASLIKKEPFSKFDNPENFFQVTSTVAWNKLFKREFIIDNQIFFSNTKACNDTKFVEISLYKADRISFLDEVLLYGRENRPGSIRSSVIRGEKYTAPALEVHKEFLNECTLDKQFENSFYNLFLEYFSLAWCVCKNSEKLNTFFRYIGFMPLKYHPKAFYRFILQPLLQKIFSIINSPDGQYKTVTFLGFKKYFKRDTNRAKTMPVHMSKAEQELFAKTVKNAKNYLEFGTGGSTFFALANSPVRVTGVESDKNWLKSLKKYKIIRENKERLFLYHANIGKTGAWGHPEDDKCKEMFPDYSSKIFDLLEYTPDTVLIDGRFRVACALKTILNCPKSAIIIHDFFNRVQYHVLLEFLDITEQADTMGVFKVKENIDMEKIKVLYEQYKYNPE